MDNMSLCSMQPARGISRGSALVFRAAYTKTKIDLVRVSSCLAYAAVLTPDHNMRDLLTYGHLVVREAQCHGGPGWGE